MSGPPERTDVRVLLSVQPPTAQTNPYVVQLAASLAALPGVRVGWFGWRRAILGRYDVLHAHWPEVMVRREGRAARAAARARFAAVLARLAVSRRTAVVRTLHNVGAHESGGRLERLLLRAFDRRTDCWIALNPATPTPDGRPAVVVPHGDYADWFAGHDVPAAEPGRLLYFGLIRPYKGVERLLDAFAALPGPGLSVRVVGRPSSPELRAAVQARVAADPRAGALLGYVPDAALAAEVGRSELVVLPYEDMHNSGALLLALSLGRPVLVPASPVTTALAAEVGEEWLLTYGGELTPQVLAKAMARGCPALSAPDLSRRRWPEVAAAHAAAYREALRRRRG